MAYNPLTCSGWIAEGTGWVATSDCMKARLGFVLLFFIIAVIRKWGGDEVGISFSFLFALICGMLPYLIILIIFGSFKIAFIIGLGGALAGGYGGGLFFESDGGDEY